MKLEDAVYLDTRPDRVGPFSPPPTVTDYAEWIRERYRRSRYAVAERWIYYGLAQAANSIVHRASHEQLQVFAYGPNAGAAAAFLEELGKGLISVEVIGV